MSSTITKLCPKLILEGTRLTGKTDLAIALNEHPRIVGVRKYRYHSPIVSAEWNGFVKNPYGSSLIDFESKYELEAISAYRAWLTLFELYRYYSWIIDRFHISTQMWQATYRGTQYKFGWLEARLAALGFRLIFCWRPPDSFAEARREASKVSSNKPPVGVGQEFGRPGGGAVLVVVLPPSQSLGRGKLSSNPAARSEGPPASLREALRGGVLEYCAKSKLSPPSR